MQVKKCIPSVVAIFAFFCLLQAQVQYEVFSLAITSQDILIPEPNALHEKLIEFALNHQTNQLDNSQSFFKHQQLTSSEHWHRQPSINKRQAKQQALNNLTNSVNVQINKQQTLVIRISALFIDESEFPLSESLFGSTIKLAVADMNRRLMRYNIEFRVTIRFCGTCARQFAGAIAAEEYHENHARLLIVSGCDEAIRSVARMAAIWSVPVLTPGGLNADLDNKRVYKTLVRVSFSVQGAVEFLIKLFKSFKWRNVNLIVDESDSNSFIIKTSILKHINKYSMKLSHDISDKNTFNTTTIINNNENNIISASKDLFHISLNEIKLDLNSLLMQDDNNTETRSSSSEDSKNKSLTALQRQQSTISSTFVSSTNKAMLAADKWPNLATDNAIREALRQSALFSHVNILLIPHSSLRRFMLSVYDLQMATGHYSFINFPLLDFSSSTFSNADDEFLWRAPASMRNSHARQAFESLMSIYLRVPTTKAYTNFVGKLLEVSTSNLGVTDNSIKTIITTATFSVNPYLASFYDCVDVYSRALVAALTQLKRYIMQHNNELRNQLTLTTTLNKSLNNSSLIERTATATTTLIANKIADFGGLVCAQIKSKKFENLVTGQLISFNENGDRETDYSLDDMSSMTGKFRPVITYKADKQAIERLGRIQWSHDQSIGVSSDEPDCTLVGTCSAKIPRFVIVLIVLLVPVALFAGGAFYYVYTRIALESQLVDYWWKIKASEVELLGCISKQTAEEQSTIVATSDGDALSEYGTSRANKSRATGSTLTSHSAGKTLATGTATQFGNATGLSTGIVSTQLDICFGGIVLGSYKLAKVALKPITKLHQSRALMVELRTIKNVSHANLARFVGIIVDEGSTAIVNEFCSKASLRQFFQSELIVIDWTFKYSIINDILAGLVYLHSSPIGLHGRLKTTNCLVNSRFVVKLADYGLGSLYSQVDNAEQSQDIILRKRVCMAPEHLKKSSSIGSKKGDSYSFGLLLYEIITGLIPFYNAETRSYTMELPKLVEELKAGGLSSKLGAELASNMSNWSRLEVNNFTLGNNSSGDAPDMQVLANLMFDCWAKEPEKRPTIAQLNTALKQITKGVTSKKLLENLTQRMEQYNNNLESLVDSKLALLLEEKSKTEELLYQFVPKSIAHILKDGQRVEPEAFKCVTVFNSDIVGFTSLSAESTPMQVVDFLQELYTCFDEILERYDIFKVETIGDAYIVASGLPERNGDRHAVEIATAAIELNKRLKSFRMKHKPTKRIEMRIGIHSGPCVAGVVGGVPKYCLFGDTVLVGKFMESNGMPNKIHITEQSKQLLESVPTFTLSARTPKVTRDGLPFATFWLEASPDNKTQITTTITSTPAIIETLN